MIQNRLCSAPSRWTYWNLEKNVEKAGVHTLQARLFRDYVKEFNFFPGQLDTYGIDLHLGNNDKFCIKYKAKREA